MVLVDVIFRCENCGQFVTKKIRLKNDMHLDIGDLPEGWIIKWGEGYFRVACPEHAILE